LQPIRSKSRSTVRRRSFRFQVPPRPTGASHRLKTEPPAASVLFNFPRAKTQETAVGRASLANCSVSQFTEFERP
jgi:hypothetical protein